MMIVRWPLEVAWPDPPEVPPEAKVMHFAGYRRKVPLENADARDQLFPKPGLIKVAYRKDSDSYGYFGRLVGRQEDLHDVQCSEEAYLLSAKRTYQIMVRE